MFVKTELKTIKVMCQAISGGIKKSSLAFNQLESKLGSLKGRKFYGVLAGSTNSGIYSACVLMNKNDDPKELFLKEWYIPGGCYLKGKVLDWEKNINIIGETFSKMAKLVTVDSGRPVIEYYRSQRELILYLPVK